MAQLDARYGSSRHVVGADHTETVLRRQVELTFEEHHSDVAVLRTDEFLKRW